MDGTILPSLQDRFQLGYNIPVCLCGTRLTLRAELSGTSSHFKSVAHVLEPGGLYMLDWCVQFGQTPAFSEDGQSWIVENNGVKVEVNVKLRDINPAEQMSANG